MADRYREHDRDDRPADAWRERDERWRSRDRDRPMTDRASDEVRSWFGDDEARRRRELDDRESERQAWRERPSGEYGRERESRSWDRGSDFNRERDFGRTDRYANVDEGTRYGSRTWGQPRATDYEPGREDYRGTSGSAFARREPTWSAGGSSEWESGPYVGRGPRGYQRSDERIKEEICERLTRHGRIDASEIDIRVTNAEVTLDGVVNDREAKRLAEDVAESVFGVRDVNNKLKMQRTEREPVGTTGRTPLGETPRRGEENTGSVLGLAGTANTPEMTPPDRTEPKKP